MTLLSHCPPHSSSALNLDLKVWGCCVSEDIGLAGVVYEPLLAYASLKLDSPHLGRLFIITIISDAY